MSTLSRTIAPARDARLTVAGIVGFTLALAAASQVAIPLPFTPVPITLQPLVVVLAGLMLGPIAGAASMVLYLAAGAAGLPSSLPSVRRGFFASSVRQAAISSPIPRQRSSRARSRDAHRRSLDAGWPPSLA